MRVDELTVEVRDASLARVGQILEADLVGSQFVPRFNGVGAWRIRLNASHAMADALRAPGAGIIVTRNDGSVLLSGLTRSAKITKTAEDPAGVWEIDGVDDSFVLGTHLAYPDPSTADVTAQASDYDTRTDVAETVMKGLVEDNIGPSAPTARKIPALTIDADLGRGQTVTAKARFDKLGELLTNIASTSGLGFTIDQDGDALVFRVYEPTDRSATVRMDVDNARLTKSEYSYTVPAATRVIVAGQGTGVDRTFVEVTTTDSTDAETEWGQRIEVFKDQRNTNDTTELEQAGAEVLADGGFTLKAVSVSPSDDQTMRYGEDWGLGDRVTVVVGSDEVVQVVTEVAVVVTEDGVKVGATVGDPFVASASDTETALAATASDQEARISNLERNEPATGSSSSAPPSAHASTHGSGGSDPVTLAQSQVTNLTTDLAAKAPLASPTFTGTATSPLLRLTDETDLSLTSTGHAFQVGPSSGTNIAMDGNEIMARNNGAASVLNLNIAGGDVSIGNTTSELNITGRIDATHYPYAVAAGSATISVVNATFGNVTVTFPTSRFSVSPIVTVTKANNVSNGAGYVVAVSSFSSTSMTIVAYDNANNATNRTLSFPVHWHAIQMTPSAGAG